MPRKDEPGLGIIGRGGVADAIRNLVTKESRLDTGGAIMRDRSYPIEEGANIGYEEWIRRYAGHIVTRDLATAHMRAWEWAESLKKGKMPPAFLACWPRGTGKSTTVELIIARMSHTIKRKFVLYVSAKQESADNHVSDIGRVMEEIGIERAVSQYGYSKGWTASRLRTGNGFNVLAYGLDAHSRGVKLDNLRPDLICHKIGTEIYTEGKFMKVEDHPTASIRHCDGIKVNLHGVPYPEVVTPEHRYWAKTITSKQIGKNTRNIRVDGEEGWVEAKDLTPRHYIAYPINYSVTGIRSIDVYRPGKITSRNAKGQVMKGNAAKENGRYEKTLLPEMLDDEWWWFFGLWWGDGHLAGKTQVGITVAHTQPHIAERLQSLLKDYAMPSWKVPKTGCDQYIFNHTALNAWLRTWKHDATKHGQKRPPQWVETIGLNYQRKLINGYVDADGYTSPKDGAIRITSVSLLGLESLRRILMRFNIASSIRKGIKARKTIISGVHCQTQDKYDLRFCAGSEVLGYTPTLSDRYQFKHQVVENGVVWSKVIGTSEVESETFVPITTPDHTYITAFGKSHNCLDDLDQEGDSAAVTMAKIEAITKAIIPAGTPDVAIFFAQNAIHAGSIMSQLLNKELQIMRNRIEDVVPAVNGLRTEEVEDRGREVIRITGGDSAWPGIANSQWEDILNAIGLRSFLVEYQHEVGAGGMFFRFQAEKDGRDWHVCEPFEIPKHWTVFAGHDYGTTAAACSYLAAVDEYGDVYVFGEEYKAGRESAEQAEAFKDMCRRYDVDPKDIIIAFDWANTFPPKETSQRLGEYPVEKWWAMNLNAIMAVKDRIAGWANLRSWLRETRLSADGTYVPRLRIMRGRTPYLQSFFERAMADPRHPEDVSVAESLTHSGDSFRYCMMQRPLASAGEASSAKEIRTAKGDTVTLPAGMDSYIRKQMESILTGRPAHEFNKPYNQARG
jgi:LAGLIDADG-like domain